MRVSSIFVLGITAILLVAILSLPAGMADPGPASSLGSAWATSGPVAPVSSQASLGNGESSSWSTMLIFGSVAGLMGLVRRRLGIA